MKVFLRQSYYLNYRFNEVMYKLISNDKDMFVMKTYSYDEYTIININIINRIFAKTKDICKGKNNESTYNI